MEQLGALLLPPEWDANPQALCLLGLRSNWLVLVCTLGRERTKHSLSKVETMELEAQIGP